MRKLIRPKEPLKLIKNKASLTQRYQANASSPVWKKDYIIIPLYESSFGKCAYCENKLLRPSKNYVSELDESKQMNLSISLLTNENNFLHIDHFIARKYSPDKVVDWDNLIPACPSCNYKKGAHNVISTPIINPYTDDVSEYFSIGKTGLLEIIGGDYAKRIKAYQTMDLFNFIDRLFPIILNIYQKIEKILYVILKNIQNVISNDVVNGNYSSLNEHRMNLTRLLQEAQPCEEYSTHKSSIILNHNYYQEIRETLKTHNLWSDELNHLASKMVIP